MAFQPTLPHIESLLVCKVFCKHYGKTAYGPTEQKADGPHSYFMWQISAATSAGSGVCYGSPPSQQPIHATDWTGKQTVDRCRYPEPHKLSEKLGATYRPFLPGYRKRSASELVTASNSKKRAPLIILHTATEAQPRRGGGVCPAAPPNPPKPKLKHKNFVATISNVLLHLPFRRNQPLKSANNCCIRIQENG